MDCVITSKRTNREYLTALYRHTKSPKTIEERLVSDANYLEAVGRFGIKKSLQVGRERHQAMEQTLKVMSRDIRRVRFYTRTGKKLGNPGIVELKNFLKRKLQDRSRQAIERNYRLN
jgi:hypothetical protein